MFKFITRDAVMPKASSLDSSIQEGEPCVKRLLVYLSANVAKDNLATSAYS
jgi:hypothetical protein